MKQLASQSELATITDVTTALSVGIAQDGAVWIAFHAAGGHISNLRIFARLPAKAVQIVLKSLRVGVDQTAGITDLTESRPLARVEATQIGLAWRVTGQVFEMPDVDLNAPPLQWKFLSQPMHPKRKKRPLRRK